MKDIEKKIHDIQSLISEYVFHRNEQIIAVDTEIVKNDEGDEVVFRVSSIPLDYMKKMPENIEKKGLRVD